MIAAVVTRLVDRTGFADEVAEAVDGVLAEVQILGTVGRDVEVVLRRDLGRQRDLGDVLAGEQRRVDELLEGNGLKLRVRVVAASLLQCRAVLPYAGENNGGLQVQVGGRVTGGIPDQLIPAEQRQVGAGRGAGGESIGRRGGQEVVFHLDLRNARSEERRV